MNTELKYQWLSKKDSSNPCSNGGLSVTDRYKSSVLTGSENNVKDPSSASSSVFFL